MLMALSCFITNIIINVLFHHADYGYYWHVYVHGYPIWTTELGFLETR